MAGPSFSWEVPPFQRSTLYDGMTSMTVDVDGTPVEVMIDPERGPVPIKVGGDAPGPNDCFRNPLMTDMDNGWDNMHKRWPNFTATERKVALYQVAKMNKQRKELGRSYWPVWDEEADAKHTEKLLKEIQPDLFK
eukprot:TRINITY_DN75238_c0_g1_i1.p1 TRINITY_DN75238_c0_g1~~TRINITY_DN75238_c0_g1_i1.p1  ORF type:complete len:153 (-),score=24.36 TRINITY_DN75238_c0_g1_i1:109-513(-)